MSCERVLDHATGFLEGTLAAAAREHVSLHLEECADCRGLIQALAAAPPGDPDILESILARTTGSACGAARARLCAFADGELQPLDLELVEGHLAHCAGCTALARVLREIEADLPLLAEADPMPGFLGDVLARTSRRPRHTPLFGRWSAAMQRLLDRPRIALEGAFVAALSVVLPITTHQASGGAASTPPLETLRHEWRATSAGALVGARAAWAAAESLMAEHLSEIAAELDRRSTETLEAIRRREGTHLGAGASSPVSDEPGTAEKTPENAQGKPQEKR